MAWRVPILFVALALSASLWAQDGNSAIATPQPGGSDSSGAPSPNGPDPVDATQPPVPGQPGSTIDKRIFGVLPNYRTADGTRPFERLDAKRKFYIAAKDSFDYPVYPLSAAFAGLYQIENQNPSFGQGVDGFAKRWGASYADQAIGNLMTEGLFPAMLREDPRYFRIGPGSGSNWHRVGYALTRVIVGKRDSGQWDFNYSEWLGNGAAVAISNLYYPSDTRNVSDNLQKWGIQVATDAFSNVLKEFWPDWKRKFFSRKKSA